MARLGFVGLGRMGFPIAARLAALGHDVRATSRDRRTMKRARTAGISTAASVADVLADVDTSIFMVRDPSAFRAVLDADDGLLRGVVERSTVIDMSTNSPTVGRMAQTALGEVGAHYVAAPVTGTPPMASAGRLSMMTGGTETTIESLMPVLRDVARSITFVGSVEAAFTLKLAINMNVALQTVGFAEAMVLAEGAGVSRSTAVDSFLASALASPMLQARAPLVLEREPVVHADMALAKKDLALALEAADAAEVTLLVTALVANLVKLSCAVGRQDEDISAIYDVLRERFGAPAVPWKQEGEG